MLGSPGLGAHISEEAGRPTKRALAKHIGRCIHDPPPTLPMSRAGGETKDQAEGRGSNGETAGSDGAEITYSAAVLGGS